MNVEVTYKEFAFSLVLDESTSGEKLVVVSLDTDAQNETVESFNDNVFFDRFVGEEIDNHSDDVERLIRRVKKSFAEFIKNGGVWTAEPKVEVIHQTKNTSNEPAGAIDRIIFETVERALSSQGSRAEIDGLIKDLIKENGVVPFRTIIKVQRNDAPPKEVGLQHYEFERILKTISAGIPIALVGPAGSGKTTLVHNVANALDMSFASQSVSAQSTTFDFFGYKNAKGEYVSTLFREKYENGGVFLLDEFDAGNPNVLAALNQATANGMAPFPDKMVEKHKDFVIVMAGNTYGGGGTIDYVGRNKIDAATLDRFAFIYIDYDEDLEHSVSTNKDWCRRVQSYRKLVVTKKVRTIISPRATFYGEKLLANGIPQKQVEEMLIFKGLNADERNLVKL